MNKETYSHVIRVASKCSSSMELRFKQPPVLLKPSASNCSCCIFRAPHSLVQINEKAYEPQIVSIGPYHHDREQLNLVEQHKPRFFSALLERTKDGGAGLNDYFKAVALMENEIRDSYSELLSESSALVEMMVLDACFIVEIFRVFGKVIEPEPADPFFTTSWIFSFLVRDLLRMENQIPFFVLQLVFDLSKGNTEDKAATPSLNELALGFFNVVAQRPQEQLKKFSAVSNVKHLLDLYRLSLIGHWEVEEPGNVEVDGLILIPSARQLLRSGIKFEPRKGDNLNLLDIQFNDGVLQIPPLTLDDFTSTFLLNCVAFEECYCYCSKHVTSYIFFMSWLLNTEMDVELLSEKQLLVSFLRSNAKVATFFHDLTDDIAFDISRSYLAKLCVQVNECRPSKWVVLLGEIERKYFRSPWSRVSAAAALVLLVLTVIQAFYAVFAYHRPPK